MKGRVMEILIPLGLVALWLILQFTILPRTGMR
jgi:hypothetical protein